MSTNPEPGTIPDPDHGIPGPAEPFDPSTDTSADDAVDLQHDDYPDDDPTPDAFGNEVGLVAPQADDGLEDPVDDSKGA